MADHTFNTTAGINRRSSQIQILDAIRECTKSAMREFKNTGFIGNWRPKSLEEARHIATGLSVEDARRRAGAMVPLFVWDKRYIPEVYQKQNKIPFQFLPDILFKKQLEEAQEKGSWNLGDEGELLREIDREDAEEAAEAGEVGPGETEDPELAELEKILAEAEGNVQGDKGQVKPGSLPDIVVVDPTKNEDGSMSASEKIRQGLKDRKYSGEPFPDDHAKARLEALAAKAPEDLTPSEKIRLGLTELEISEGED